MPVVTSSLSGLGLEEVWQRLVEVARKEEIQAAARMGVVLNSRHQYKLMQSKKNLSELLEDLASGFPGEEEEDFASSREFVNEVKPSRLHVFKYSDRKGTVSSGFSDKVPADVAKGRVSLLISDGDMLQAGFCKNFVDKEVEVLVEEKSSGTWLEGYSGEYLRVRIYGTGADKGKIVPVAVESVDKDMPCLVGKIKKDSQ